MERKLPPFDIGEPVSMDVEFWDHGHLADPQVVTLRLVCPDKVVLNFTLSDLTRIEEGVYTCLYTVANGFGTYRGTWTSIGNLTVIRQFSFPVRRPDSG